MINVLRIISLVAAILTVVFFVFPFIYGTNNDEHVKEFLETPEIRAKFENAADSRIQKNKDRTSPLVQQAQAFASFLNPKPEQKRASTISRGSKVIDKLPVTPKFTLRCTSYCPEDPNMSLALIDEPGKGRHWVKPSSKVGHLLVEKIKDGLIVVNGGQESFELKIDESSVKESAVSRNTGSKNRFKPTTPLSGKSSPSYKRPSTTVTKTTNADQDKDREARAIALIEKLRNLKQNTLSDKNAGEESKEKAAKIEKLFSQYQSTLISPEEAKKLGNLGKTLKDAESDPNRTPSETGKTR